MARALAAIRGGEARRLALQLGEGRRERCTSISQISVMACSAAVSGPTRDAARISRAASRAVLDRWRTAVPAGLPSRDRG
jgi:hypothetical protein